MSRFPTPSPPRAEAASCGGLLREIQELWDEIGESESERDKMILQLEQECLNLYQRKVDNARKHKSDLLKTLANGQAEISKAISSLGDRESLYQLEKPKGSLKEQVAMIKPTLESLRRKREERIKEFVDVQSEIINIRSEIAGNLNYKSSNVQIDEQDLSLKKLEELRAQLQELQKDKEVRLQKVNGYVEMIYQLANVMSLEINEILCEIHPCFEDLKSNSKSISNETLTKLESTVNALKQEKKQRLLKIQGLVSTLMHLWKLMETSDEERQNFEHVTGLVSRSVESVTCQGRLGLNIIEKVELEVQRLNLLKASKMKEIVLKKQDELEEIYRAVHMDFESDKERQILVDRIDSGRADLSELLGEMENRIVKAKEQANSRKEILEKMEKWQFAIEEETWLDEYERDQNRYNAGRGAHKNLKRAEKARILVGKTQLLVDNLILKIEAWEKEREIPLMYDKTRLLEKLESYKQMKKKKEEEKRRSREQRRLQEQFAAEQEAMFGAKPSPLRQLPAKKPLGQSSVNVAGTPINRRVSTSRPVVSSSGKDRRNTPAPANYVALNKDASAIFSP
ncbi:hypothetical protein LUZ60_003944 [Juncus effusus]|nr:hypothetical protein LUZ60_003944 [Juncus effusus]